MPFGINLALSGAFFDTPRFVYVFGLSGLYTGWLSGAILGLSGWIAQLGVQYGKFSPVKLVAYSLPVVVALAVLLVLLFSPLNFLQAVLESLGQTDIAN